MFVLIFLKKKLQGSFLDKIIRHASNIFSKLYYNLSKNYNLSKKTQFIFICYGGLGDCILSFKFLNQLSLKYPLTVFLEEKFKDLSCLLNRNIKVINYLKPKLFKSLSNYGKFKENHILIQQSPILEFMFFHFCLGRPSTIGYIHAQNLISAKGIGLENKYCHSKNKLSKYDYLLEQIFLIEKKNSFLKENYIDYNIFELSCKFVPKKKYFIISPTKNYKWEMGFLDPVVYAKFIVDIYEKQKIIPIIIGTKEDDLMINKITKHIPKNVNYHNLSGLTSIKDLIPLIINSIFVVANDNGIHHLSNFLNSRTLTLYNFSSHEVYNWSNKNSEYIFNPVFSCMPCVGNQNGPFDNYPFKCPWKVRCKNTISSKNIVSKLKEVKWIS